MSSVEAQPSGDLRTYSDEDLIKLALQSITEDAFKVLWERCTSPARLEKVFRPTICRLCPSGVESSFFVKMVLDEAYVNFCRRLKGYSFKGILAAWQISVVFSTARDVRRRITRQRAKPKNVAAEDTAEQQAKPEETVSTEVVLVPLSELTDRELDRAMFKNSAAMKKERARALHEMVIEERASVIQKALKLYACRSSMNAASCRALVLHFWEDWSWVRLANLMLADRTDIELASRAQSMKRLVKEDFEEVGLVLQEEFGITRDILSERSE
jgi:DNA-directed RNA polymerase specialized sigma24 family protein